VVRLVAGTQVVDVTVAKVDVNVTLPLPERAGAGLALFLLAVLADFTVGLPRVGLCNLNENGCAQRKNRCCDDDGCFHSCLGCREWGRGPRGKSARLAGFLDRIERATPLQALQAITINAAYEYGEEGSKGSLEPGKLADLVILDKNPLKVEPMTIKDIKVVETIKDGATIYKAQ
jgi:hypothetical protein